MLKKLWSFWRALEGLGVSGLDEVYTSWSAAVVALGTGMGGARFLGRGVPGVIVMLVVVVVDERGLD